jgi:hypothetical protein
MYRASHISSAGLNVRDTHVSVCFCATPSLNTLLNVASKLPNDRSMVPAGTEENLLELIDGRAARFYRLFRADLVSLATGPPHTGPGYKSNRTISGPGNSSRQLYLSNLFHFVFLSYRHAFYPCFLRLRGYIK